MPSTYNTFGSGYFPSSSYLSNIYPTVVSHYLYFPGGNPWEPGRNFIDLRVNPYPWYLRYYGGLGSGFGSTTFPGGFGTFGSSLGFPSGLDGSLTTGYQTNGFPFGSSFGIDPSFSTLTGSLGYGNIGFQGLGGYIPTGNLGGNFYRSKHLLHMYIIKTSYFIKKSYYFLRLCFCCIFIFFFFAEKVY